MWPISKQLRPAKFESVPPRRKYSMWYFIEIRQTGRDNLFLSVLKDIKA